MLTAAAALLVGVLVLVRLSGAGQFTAALWEPFTYEGVQRRILTGVVDTLTAFALAAVLSLLLGLLLAGGTLARHRPVRVTATTVVAFLRAVPVLILVFTLYNLTALRLLLDRTGTTLSGHLGDAGTWAAVHVTDVTLWALVLGVALHNGAVQADILRSGIRAVPRGQVEAAHALGMSRTQTAWSVVLPQAVRAMLPSIVAQLAVTLKDTSLGFIIMYEELLYVGKLLAQNIATPRGYPYLPVLFVVGLLYVAMCLAISALARRLARRSTRAPNVSRDPEESRR
ncbi:ABC transporter permease subunit [Streptomyces sp. TRM S81-3]|uniref:ABC transporter permease subunit n=1 Tax=Streptomyces griseicoloratus TaxID=2752516 RepID=A0A926L4U7_9ACTN|nr:ABC transporter permease subunit [Streptomyces griseicoloratus]MBD0421636.1 ABC transporter permease subunit [Streptomyces griseicoloratus]